MDWPEQNKYQTTDMAEAAYYLSTGLTCTTSIPYQKVLFCFDDSKDRENKHDLYWNGRASVEPTAFASQLRQLKSRIHKLKGDR